MGTGAIVLLCPFPVAFLPFSCQSLRSAEWLEAKSVELQQAEQCTPFSQFVTPPVVDAGTMVLPCLSLATLMPFSCLLGAVFLPVLKFCVYNHKLVAGSGLMMVEQSTVKKTRGNLGKTRKKTEKHGTGELTC